MPTNIPDDVRNKIAEKYPFVIGGYTGVHAINEKVQEQKDCAEFGYSLAANKIEEKDKEIERLKGLIEKAHYDGYNDFEQYSWPISWCGFKTDNNL